MFQVTSRLVINERITQDCWRMVLDAPEIGSEIKPGQFIMLKITETNDPLFRRPFSVFRKVSLDHGVGIEVVYKVVGRGTQLMTHLEQGTQLDMIGPLGHGFKRRRDRKTHVLVGGGTGLACLFMLGEEISKTTNESGHELVLLLGAETKKSLILEKDFRSLNGKAMVSTDDGTYGYHGFVTDMLKTAIDEGTISSDCAIYASGPEPMLRALAPICHQYRIAAQISMERHMMCGIGGCFVCVCKVDKRNVLKNRDLKSSHIQFGPEEWGYALACKDGPVFSIDEVIFDE